RTASPTRVAALVALGRGGLERRLGHILRTAGSLRARRDARPSTVIGTAAWRLLASRAASVSIHVSRSNAAHVSLALSPLRIPVQYAHSTKSRSPSAGSAASTA